MKVEFKDGDGFYPKMFLNCFFIVITFGLYLPWGMTAIRQEIWARTSLNGERFYYLGQVKELIFGYIILSMILLFSTITQYGFPYIFPKNIMIIAVGAILGSLIFSTIFYKAKLGSFRYQVNRTLYNGIRFSTQLDSLKRLYLMCLKWGIITFVTFGIAFPYFLFKTDVIKYNSLRYGSEKFKFTMVFSDYISIVTKHTLVLLGLFIAFFSAFTLAQVNISKTAANLTPGAIALWSCLSIIAAVIYMFFVSSLFVNLFRKKVECLSSENISFSTSITVRRAVKYHIINALIIICTFGIGFPLALANNIKLYANTITVIGADQLVTQSSLDSNESQASSSFDDVFADNFSLDMFDAF